MHERDPIVIGRHFGHQIRQCRLLEPLRLDVGDCHGDRHGDQGRRQGNVDGRCVGASEARTIEEADLDGEQEKS